MTTASKTTTAFRTGVSKHENSFAAGEEAAKQAVGKLSHTPNFGIVFCSSKYDYPELLRGIKSVAGDAQIIGCSSASEFTEEHVGKDSVVVAFISSDTHHFYTGHGVGMSNDSLEAVQAACAKFPEEVAGFPYKSALLLIDGLSGKGEDACASALCALGPTVRFAGGAAADNLAFKATHVFHNDKAYTDATALCLMISQKPVYIGVKHGHHPISPPLTITKATDNVVYEIEKRPAFELWKEYTREKAKARGFDVDNLKDASEVGSFFLQYETGLQTGQDYKVRAPLSLNPDGSVNFACMMLEGSVIRIMESPNKACQIDSARDAAKAAFAAARGTKLAGAVIFDCVCRNLILDSDFAKGVDEIKNVIGNIPVIGFATYGEIAMEMGQLSGFHNTTTVVVLIPE